MTSAANAGMPEQGCGDRLREARAAAGLDIADVAAKMHVPVRVVESLEAEDWGRLGAPVFVRGQLRSYARALGLPPDALLPAQASTPIQPPQLEPRTFTSPLQRFAEQAARRLVYVVITAAIAVPVWMVTRQHVDSDPQETASLDIDPGRGQAAAAPGRSSPSSQAEQQPFVASLTPIQSRKSQKPRSPEPQQPSAAALTLQFSDDSWVEVQSAEGRSLEQALVRAGERRSYAAGEVGRIVLGNAGAVEVRRYGRVQDMTPYQRANVARFTVSSDGSMAPATE
ncbi:helix-turn-helix domain-containing protein [Luteimonas suaedae]|uniref:helix-turn-helix domain-containing protein n=1 Tax=Luteimonas suaedae TaxID=2605430 RepID=UPI0011EBA88B|nr:helix-turn-helix domain-containing protein [Luteimonas suaedae]